MGNKYIMRNCYWCHEYQDMNATVPTCDYYGHFGRCPCKDECEHYISEPEVENIIRKRAETEWIPCSERLPDKDGWYLITVQGYEKVVDMEWYYGEWGAWNGVSSEQQVIAWMPLPKPYREDGEV